MPRLVHLLPNCPELPPDIQLSIEPCRIEYLAGRYCAVQALLNQGVTAPRIERNIDRSPCWPAGTIGSLSHTDDRVIACAAWQTEYCGMGIDVEKTVSEEMVSALRHLVFTERDRRVVDASSLFLCQIATLLFSAKEAFYKCIYPQTLIQMDFIDVSLVSFNENHFILQINRDLGGVWKEGVKVCGVYSYENEHVITLLVV